MTAVNSVYCSWATWSSRPVLCMCVTWYHICFLVTSSGPLVTKRTCIEVQSHLAPLMCNLSKYFSWWFQVSVASFKSYWIQRVYFVLYGPIRGGESRVHIWMSQTCDWLVATLQALQCLLQSWLVVLEQKKLRVADCRVNKPKVRPRSTSHSVLPISKYQDISAWNTVLQTSQWDLTPQLVVSPGFILFFFLGIPHNCM